MSAFRRVVILILCLFPAGASGQQRGGALTVADYIAELDRLSAAAKSEPAPQLMRRIPPEWFVQSEGKTFRIDTQRIRNGLTSSENPTKVLLSRIAGLKQEIRDYQIPPRNISSSQKALASILARREFRDIRGPTLWDEYRQKIYRFLLGLMLRILGNSAFPTVSTILIWILAAAAFFALVFWTFNTMDGTRKLERMAAETSGVFDRRWTDWIAKAKAAAAAGSWRDAVHLTYWTGIFFLEELGAWRPDSARTPREYLRLLPSDGEHFAPLSALTRQFEVIWYGGAEAGPESFSEALKQLENLGCRTS